MKSSYHIYYTGTHHIPPIYSDTILKTRTAKVPHITDKINYIQHTLHYSALHRTPKGLYVHYTSAPVISVIPVNGLYYDHWSKDQPLGTRPPLEFIAII